MTQVSRFSALRRVAKEFDSVALRRLARAEKALACAALFVPDYSRHTAAISTLLASCEGPTSCATGMQDLRDSGYAALGRSAGGANIEILAQEYRRLFGDGPGADKIPLPVVPVCACSYLSGDEGDSLGDVVARYRAIDFDATRDPDRCPGHIATELEFHAHCLRLAASSDGEALAMSRDFVVSHLFPWGVVCAAATLSKAQHPVTRLAGEALEHVLFCELNEARALE